MKIIQESKRMKRRELAKIAEKKLKNAKGE